MTTFIEHLQTELANLEKAGLYKHERVIESKQSTAIEVGHHDVLNFCANNYLGLSDNPTLIQTGQTALDQYGFGLSSVRFICGTQDIHKQLEAKISEFLGMEDTILYSSCFDANGGLFETLLGPEDAIISDQLNHASIIDGVRLCKAKRFRYLNNDMIDLEAKLKEATEQGARYKLIATDGVFSMDGIIADLKSICDLADKYDAMVMVDDSHAVGFIGEGGRGTPEYCGVADRVDIITGTLGKALGGASGGYTSAKNKEIVAWLRNRSRPYLFSNTLAPVITATSIKVIDMLSGEEGKQLRAQLTQNSEYFREKMSALGFDLIPGHHPIIPVMLGDAKLASDMANALLDEGVYVVGFSYPVVPMGQARIRVQMWDEWSQNNVPVPLTTGHEFVGIVDELGEGVTHFNVGDRVSGEGHLTCMHCRNCRAGNQHLCRHTDGVGVNRPGAFADYIVIPAANAYPIPEDISDDEAAMLDPYGNAVHATLSYDLVGEDVLVTGAGPIGLMSAAIAKHVGARHVVITDINPFRLKMAKEMGIEMAINPQETSLNDVMHDIGMKEGFDVGIEMSGSEFAFRDMIAHMNHGGKIALLGILKNDIGIAWQDVIFKSLMIKGIYGREIFDTWYKGISMLQSGLDIMPVVTQQLSAEAFDTGFQAMLSGQAGKVILDWT